MQTLIIIRFCQACEPLKFIKPGSSLRTIANPDLQYKNLFRQETFLRKPIEHLAEMFYRHGDKFGIAGISSTARKGRLIPFLKCRLPFIKSIPEKRIERPDDTMPGQLKWLKIEILSSFIIFYGDLL